jgi:chemotaxis protein CheZ
MMSERKLFTAELQRLKTRTGDAAAAHPSAPPPPVDNEEVLRALDEIRLELKALTHAVKGDDTVGLSEGPPAHLTDMVQQKQAEVSMLKTELRALAVCIEQTKAEIAALKPAEANDDRLVAVAFELDAIVSSTERATQQILEASEKIETITREIRSHSSDGYVSRLAEDINDTIVSIFEACNFQDITGQRITKVVRTLNYIEARVTAMIDIWGSESLADIAPKATEEHQDEEAKLLNGPALENQGISQDEIDKLFG